MACQVQDKTINDVLELLVAEGFEGMAMAIGTPIAARCFIVIPDELEARLQWLEYLIKASRRLASAVRRFLSSTSPRFSWSFPSSILSSASRH